MTSQRSINQYLTEWSFKEYLNKVGEQFSGGSEPWKDTVKRVLKQHPESKPMMNMVKPGLSDKVDKVLDNRSSIISRIGKRSIVDDVRTVAKEGPPYIKKYGSTIAKNAWENTTPKQKKDALLNTAGYILKGVGTRLIGGPVGYIASTLGGWTASDQNRKLQDEEVKSYLTL